MIHANTISITYYIKTQVNIRIGIVSVYTMWLATLFRPQSLIPQTSPPENPVYKHNNQLDILFAKKKSNIICPSSLSNTNVIQVSMLIFVSPHNFHDLRCKLC